MALGKKPTGGERRPQACRKDEPTGKPMGGHKKFEAREKDVQTRGSLISRNLPTKPAFFDLAVNHEIARTRYASPRFYRSLPVPAKAPAVRPTEPAADVESVDLVPQSPAGDCAAPSPKDVDVPDTDGGAEYAGDFFTNVPPHGARPNGDEVDFRMAMIYEILRHASMPLLEKCGLATEWLHHAEAKLSISGQDVAKLTGRPEGALTRAARELPVPGSSLKARRKFMERALKIDGIRPEAKTAAHAAGLDNIQSALLSIAAERSVEAQLAKVQEIAARKAMPRRKSTTRNRGEAAAVESVVSQQSESGDQPAVDLPEIAQPKGVWSADDETQHGIPRDDWIKKNVLRRVEWEKSSPEVQRRFARDFLLGA